MNKDIEKEYELNEYTVDEFEEQLKEQCNLAEANLENCIIIMKNYGGYEHVVRGVLHEKSLHDVAKEILKSGGIETDDKAEMSNRKSLHEMMAGGKNNDFKDLNSIEEIEKKLSKMSLNDIAKNILTISGINNNKEMLNKKNNDSQIFNSLTGVKYKKELKEKLFPPYSVQRGIIFDKEKSIGQLNLSKESNEILGKFIERAMNEKYEKDFKISELDNIRGNNKNLNIKWEQKEIQVMEGKIKAGKDLELEVQLWKWEKNDKETMSSIMLLSGEGKLYQKSERIKGDLNGAVVKMEDILEKIIKGTEKKKEGSEYDNCVREIGKYYNVESIEDDRKGVSCYKYEYMINDSMLEKLKRAGMKVYDVCDMYPAYEDRNKGIIKFKYKDKDENVINVLQSKDGTLGRNSEMWIMSRDFNRDEAEDIMKQTREMKKKENMKESDKNLSR
jgi:hypothetical protein